MVRYAEIRSWLSEQLQEYVVTSWHHSCVLPIVSPGINFLLLMWEASVLKTSAFWVMYVLKGCYSLPPPQQKATNDAAAPFLRSRADTQISNSEKLREHLMRCTAASPPVEPTAACHADSSWGKGRSSSPFWLASGLQGFAGWEQAELPGTAWPDSAISWPTVAHGVFLLRCGAKATKVKWSFSSEKQNCALEREARNLFP